MDLQAALTQPKERVSTLGNSSPVDNNAVLKSDGVSLLKLRRRSFRMLSRMWLAITPLIIAATSIACVIRDSTRNELRIGAIFSLSGDKAAYGESAKNGLELAVSEINAAGGIQGKRLTILYEDGRGSAKDAVSAFEKLSTLDKVPVVIGPLTSSEVLAIAPIAEKRRVVVLSPGASSPAISTAGDYIFRNVPSDVFEGSAMAEVARTKLGLTKVAVIYVNNEYGNGVLNVFRDKFSRIGGAIVATQGYSDGAHDFRTQIVELKAKNPDAVYLLGYKELGLIVRQITELGLRTKLLSTALFEDPEVIKSAGVGAEGLVFTSIAFDPNAANDRAKAFVEAYVGRYRAQPDSFAAVSYDAGRIMAAAMSSADASAPQIKDVLYRTKNYPGLLGETSFDENGDVVLPVNLKTVKDGKFIAFR